MYRQLQQTRYRIQATRTETFFPWLLFSTQKFTMGLSRTPVSITNNFWFLFRVWGCGRLLYTCSLRPTHSRCITQHSFGGVRKSFKWLSGRFSDFLEKPGGYWTDTVHIIIWEKVLCQISKFSTTKDEPILKFFEHPPTSFSENKMLQDKKCQTVCFSLMTTGTAKLIYCSPSLQKLHQRLSVVLPLW